MHHGTIANFMNLTKRSVFVETLGFFNPALNETPEGLAALPRHALLVKSQMTL